ncbi:C3a anaphylatoxin chemotactic receptor-like [Mizuhopecten yessoensis]|uniref:C3a anaphylatoxin chemotactic receptor-like n=1 Tax=Mizuhopecten yessoensis TaxID=6573 RepID=UPI000B4571B6|nr:C3a anaphylatoxin chemotactic receptor-like [Mizuhopecten yessoensis]
MSANMTQVLSLLEISQLESQQRLPTVVYLCVLIILGVLGNSVVIFVYIFRYSRSDLRLYILCLAVLDMLACCVSMPAELVDNYWPYMFYSDAFCKIQRFIGNVAKIGSAFVITLMAIERHRRVCGPGFSGAPPKLSHLYCGCAIGLTLLISWPKAVISGTIMEHFPGNITGHDCSVADAVRNTKIPFIYTIIQLVIFLVSFVLLIILYSLIVRSLYRHSTQPAHTGSDRGLRLLRRSRKVTKIMMAISAAFLISYLPHFVITTLSTMKQTKNLLAPSQLVLGVLPLLYRSYFINNVVNPIIYIVGDGQFRSICYEKFCCLLPQSLRKSGKCNTLRKNHDNMAKDAMLTAKGVNETIRI